MDPQADPQQRSSLELCRQVLGLEASLWNNPCLGLGRCGAIQFQAGITQRPGFQPCLSHCGEEHTLWVGGPPEDPLSAHAQKVGILQEGPKADFHPSHGSAVGNRQQWGMGTGIILARPCPMTPPVPCATQGQYSPPSTIDTL